MKKLLAIIALAPLILVGGCQKDDVDAGETSDDLGHAGAYYSEVSVEEAQQLIADRSDLVIIDVSPKYDEGHLPGAINYYVGDGSLEAAISDLDSTVPYLVYCHVDSASIAGAQLLVDNEFSEVYRLIGNYAAWVEAGYPIEK